MDLPSTPLNGTPRSRHAGAGAPFLADGNRLQRAYARWAAPYYARMAPAMRA